MSAHAERPACGKRCWSEWCHCACTDYSCDPDPVCGCGHVGGSVGCERAHGRTQEMAGNDEDGIPYL